MNDHNADVDAVLAALSWLDTLIIPLPKEQRWSAATASQQAKRAMVRIRAALPVDDADDLDMADGVAVWEVAE